MSWTYIFIDPNGEGIIGTFHENDLQKTNQTEFRIAKLIKSKGNKIYATWNGHNDSLNSWSDKKRRSINR